MICCLCAAETESAPCLACGADPLLDGRYRLIEVLGRGSATTTYRAEQLDTGASVVVKESPLHWQVPDKIAALAQREAEVLRPARPPEHPRLHRQPRRGAGQGQEPVPDPGTRRRIDLQQHLQTHRTPRRRSCGTLRSLCDILTYLHGLSPPVIHRDLKPANVVRRPDGRLVLVDFGAVRDVLKDAEVGGSTVAGTFGFMAPEQFHGDADPRTDLYALGALGVALLTRRDPTSLIGGDRRIHWRDHASVGPPTRQLLDKLLAPDPADRPVSAEATAQRINRILARPLQKHSNALPAPGPGRPPWPSP